MIVKIVEHTKRKPNSTRNLLDYLNNPQGKEHRVGDIRFTNLFSDNIKDSIDEFELVQNRNVRAKSPDIMHLVVSFPYGEIPSADVLHMIEDRLVNALDMSEHQHVSVVHNDTDHCHMHIAINKIHPETFKMHDPYQSWNRLAQCCVDCERDYGLIRDNHVVNHVLIDSDGIKHEQRYTPDENYIRNQKARDMDFRIESQSLIRFMKDNVKDKLYQAKNWQEFHEVLAENGLMVREQANGYVFQSVASGINVKASSISRGLSKKNLIKQLGEFQPSTRPVQPKPVTFERNQQLFDKYLEQKKALSRSINAVEIERVRLESKRRREHIYASFKEARKNAYKIKVLSLEERQKYLESLKILRQQELDKLRQQTNEQIQQLRAPLKRMGFVEWLQQEASLGNAEALLELRKRTEFKLNQHSKFIRMQEITSEAPADLFTKNMPIDSVTKHGTIIYRCADTTVRDTGDRLHIDNDASPEVLRTVLKTAQKKFQGEALTLNGSEEFKTQVLVVASVMKEEFVFKDANIQKQYLELKEKAYGERRHGKFGIFADVGHRQNDERRGNIRDDRRVGTEYSVWGQFANDYGHQVRRNSIVASQLTDFVREHAHDIQYPDIRELTDKVRGKFERIDILNVARRAERAQRKNPTGLQIVSPHLSRETIGGIVRRRRESDAMHEMSSVVLDAESLARKKRLGGEMHTAIRSGSIQHHELPIGRQNADVRRLFASHSAEGSGGKIDFVQQYVDQRNLTRQRVPTILPHRIMQEGESGTYFYNGMRHLEGTTVVLLKKNNEMVVKPISPAEVKKYKTQTVNSEISVSNVQQRKGYGRR